MLINYLSHSLLYYTIERISAWAWQNYAVAAMD